MELISWKHWCVADNDSDGNGNGSGNGNTSNGNGSRNGLENKQGIFIIKFVWD